MALWDKLKTELDRAGKAAQTAFDEGKVRLEVLRVRQLADKAAQQLGYAVYRARQSGQELDTESYARLSSTLAAHEAEVQRLEAQLAAARESRTADQAAPAAPASDSPYGAGSATPGSSTASSTPPSSTPEAGGPTSHVDPAMGDMGRSEPPPSTI